MSAKETAIRDIKEYLKSEGKSFISYSREMNKPIKQITKDWIKMQNSICLSCWSVKTK